MLSERLVRVGAAIGVIVLTAGLALHAQLGGESGRGSSGACTVEQLQRKAPAGTTITSASIVEAAGKIPRYCRVDGHATSSGNEVNFRLGLPESWNGKYYFQGVGGLGGTIGSLNAGLERGYVSASTDTGHDAKDPTWGSNRAKEIDYGHRGTHVTAVAAKALTTSFYDRPPAHSYFNGCSNGGRQAMMEVQRYPTDFDGIIAGDPATGTPLQSTRALVYQFMLASPEHYVPAAKLELLSKATLAACDASDGLKDGLITDPRLCTFRPETLKCSAGDGLDCLTAGQLETVKRLYADVKLANGQIYASGFPVGHEGGTSGWRQWITGRTEPTRQADGALAYGGEELPSGYRLSEQNFRFLALDNDDPNFNWRAFNLDRDLPRMKTMSEILSPTDPDLTPFKKAGGRLIIYHGWSDPAISALGTLRYYEQMTKAVGGQREADAFSRLYFVPGMHHCSGGPGPNQFDMLTALESWVERGQAPAAVIASHAVDGKVDCTRPLCPHPQVARYSGTGSVDEAQNFKCEAR